MKELREKFITTESEYKEGAVSVLRQKFSLEKAGSHVVSAVFTSTAQGVYEAELNRSKVGEQMFAPGYTYYPRRLLYCLLYTSHLQSNGGVELAVGDTISLTVGNLSLIHIYPAGCKISILHCDVYAVHYRIYIPVCSNKISTELSD